MNIDNIALVRATNVIPFEGIVQPVNESMHLRKENGTEFSFAMRDLLKREGKLKEIDWSNPDAISEIEKENSSILSEYMPYSTEYNSMVLWSLNGLVPDDMNNTFSNKTCAIIESLEAQIDKSEIISIVPTDTAIKGNVQLSNDAIILIDKGRYDGLSDKEKEKIKNLGLTVKIFEGDLKTAVDTSLEESGKYTAETLSLRREDKGYIQSETSEELLNTIDKIAADKNIPQVLHWNVITGQNDEKDKMDSVKDEFENGLIVRDFYKKAFLEYLFSKISIDENVKGCAICFSDSAQYMQDLCSEIERIGIGQYKEIVDEYNEGIVYLREKSILPTPQEIVNANKQNNPIDLVEMMKEKENSREYVAIVDEVCDKFGYSKEDQEGNYSLRTVLLKIIPEMLKDRTEEDKQLFYQMLEHTPIVITQNLTEEGLRKLKEEYIGDINPNIVEEEVDNMGEYSKTLGDGAYVSSCILDDELKVSGKKSFVYMQKVNEDQKNFFGTDINVAHLIHELGHAWHSEKDEYSNQEDGTLKERVGTAEFIYSFKKREDGKFTQKCEKVTGLMIEEAMNTIAEEKAMAGYMGMDLETIRSEYGQTLQLSNYQGYMRSFVEYMLENLHEADFEYFRLHGDLDSKEKIESLMRRTKYWQDRETDILPNSESPRNYGRKREIIGKVQSKRVQDFFEEYEEVYFPNISEMTPLEKIDNVLSQTYNMKTIKYNLGLDVYKEFLDNLGYEGFSLINQTSKLMKEEELRKTVENVKSSEISEITTETRQIYSRTNERDLETLEKGEESR